MKVHESRGDRIYLRVNTIILVVLAVAVLYPLIYVVSASLSSATAIANNEVLLWPVGFNLDAYKTLLDSPRLVVGFLNSLVYTIAGAAIGTALTMLAGYVLSREDVPGRRLLVFFFLVPTLVTAGVVPLYIVVRQLGMLDTRWAIIVPSAMSVFNVIITRTFFAMNVPRELREAAGVDGASDFRFFFTIALPLSKPIIAVNMLFYGLAQWNGWFPAFLFTNNPDIAPLQLVLRELLAQSAVNPAVIGNGDLSQILAKRELFAKLKYAIIVVSMIPPLIIYPFVQKYFVKGALIGSLK